MADKVAKERDFYGDFLSVNHYALITLGQTVPAGSVRPADRNGLRACGMWGVLCRLVEQLLCHPAGFYYAPLAVCSLDALAEALKRL